jgi:hypothetical protein
MPETTAIQIESQNIKVTPYGLEFTGAVSLKEWKRAMLGLQKAETMIQFYLGDLFIYAESAVDGWGKLTYQDLEEHSGYDNGTLRNYKWVARRFPPAFREALSPRGDICAFSHYKEVASIDDDQEAFRLLKTTNKAGWSVEKLHDEVKRSKGYAGKDLIKGDWINLSLSRQEAKNLIDILADYPEDPIAYSISGRLGTLLEAE